jgi:hypothetical protein
MDELNPLINNRVVGIVNVDLSALAFPWGREEDPLIVDGLIELFRNNSKGCDRNTEENYIPAIISEAELNTILGTNGLTQEDLQRTVSVASYRPKIVVSNFDLNCVHGKHRIKAAREVLCSTDAWWTVKLFSFDTSSK